MEYCKDGGMYMAKKYVVALDQGTTSCRAIIFNHGGEILGMCQKEFTQFYPQAGWVEHDALEILDVQKEILFQLLNEQHVLPEEIAAIGITNQRETAMIWDKRTGKPIYNAIVWQSRQTASICEELKNKGHEPYIRHATGLVVDAYFSGTKIKWILDKVEGARALAEEGHLLCGTMDTWLIWNLTREKAHVTEYSNASRTMLFNIHTLKWDQNLLEMLTIPSSLLPEVKESSTVFGHMEIDGVSIPISGAAGDQQAALFGQACFDEGMVKNTYGTGCFILMNTGERVVTSHNGLLTTIGWGINGKVTYALEGSIFMAGAVVQWLRDEMELINHASETDGLARSVECTNGVYLVPAFAGLGAPYWDMYARGTMVGLTRGANKKHIVRAALEAIAYQSKDVIHAMEQDSEINLRALKVDGGACANDFLMEFQSDILDVPVRRPKVIETTALGAAYMAGLAVGFWKNADELVAGEAISKEFRPKMSKERRERLYSGWQRAIDRSKNWVE